MRILLLAILLLPIFVIAQNPVFTKKYLMPFHYCSGTNCGNPMNHTTSIAESDDGTTWTIVPNMPTIHGSVPDAVIRANTLYLYNPGNVKKYDNVAHTWNLTPSQVSITDGSGNNVQFVDPSPTIDSSDNIVLFYLNSTGSMGDPAQCTTYPCTKYFDSAIEVQGSDGTQFVQQSGHRLSITLNSGTASDPDIYFDGIKYILYTSAGNVTKAYSSNSLHGSYNAISTLPNNGELTNAGGIPCGYHDNLSNNYWTYVHGNNAGNTEIRRLVHANFNASTNNFTAVITGTSIGLGSNYSVASPGFLVNGFVTSTRLNEVTSNKAIIIFPNPVNDKLYLSGAKDVFQISITSIIGAEVMNVRMNNDYVDVSLLKSGVYFINIFDKEKVIKVSKFIKE